MGQSPPSPSMSTHRKTRHPFYSATNHIKFAFGNTKSKRDTTGKHIHTHLNASYEHSSIVTYTRIYCIYYYLYIIIVIVISRPNFWISINKIYMFMLCEHIHDSRSFSIRENGCIYMYTQSTVYHKLYLYTSIYSYKNILPMCLESKESLSHFRAYHRLFIIALTTANLKSIQFARMGYFIIAFCIFDKVWITFFSPFRFPCWWLDSLAYARNGIETAIIFHLLVC